MSTYAILQSEQPDVGVEGDLPHLSLRAIPLILIGILISTTDPMKHFEEIDQLDLDVADLHKQGSAVLTVVIRCWGIAITAAPFVFHCSVGRTPQDADLCGVVRVCR